MRKILFRHFYWRIFCDLEKFEYTIDESRFIQYSDYGKCRNRESRTAPISQKPEIFENEI